MRSMASDEIKFEFPLPIERKYFLFQEVIESLLNRINLEHETNLIIYMEKG